MEVNKIYCESCMDTLKSMQNESIDCVITSPPYWQLRDYGYPEQWGLEPTFLQYLEHLWQMMDEIYRVLKPMGTVWVNLGDSYSTQSGTNTALSKGEKNWDTSVTYLTNRGESGKIQKGNLPSKCLLLLPHRFAIGCIDRKWVVRNDIVWAKRNGMPESVTDRFSKKHEYFFFMVKQEKYYFDLDAVRDKVKEVTIERMQRGISENNKWVNGADGQTPHNLSQPRKNTTKNIKGNMSIEGLTRTTAGLSLKTAEEKLNLNGKNPGSVSDFWDIPTKPSSNKHYASYNDALITKPILAGCPENGVIYDPFMGTGSTAEAAIRANRKFIGSEMSKEYCDIANKRLQTYLNQPTLL